MDLLTIYRVKSRRVCSLFLSVGFSLFLFGCTTVQEQPPTEQAATEVESETAPVEMIEPVEEKKAYLPLSPELMYYVLTAEIAGQRGEMGVAVDLYHRASELVDSPSLASRSAQVATYSRDRERINRALQRWLEVEPEAADVYIMQAPFLMLKGDYDGVVASVNKAIALSPVDGPEYLTRLTQTLTELAPPEQGMQVYEQLQCVQENKPYATYAYARVAAFYKHHDKALELVDGLLKQDPKNNDYLVLKAELLQSMERSDEALDLIESAAKKESASEQTRFTYGKLLGDHGKTKQAQKVFEKLNQDNPENKDVLYALGLLALENDEAKQAKQYFSELLKRGDPSHQSEYFIGTAEQQLGNVDAALVWFASVPVKSARFDMAQNRYVHLLADQGDLDKARDHLKLLRQEHPNKAEFCYLLESSLLRERGLDEQSFDLLTSAVNSFPNSNDIRYSRAMVAEALGNIDALEADLLSILAREPDNAQALNALGYTLTDRTDRHQEALGLIEKALKIKPDEPFYLDSLGWVYYRLGDLDKAILYLEKAVAIQPDVEFIAHLGEVYWKKGEQEKAKEIWQRGLKLNAENSLLINTMRRFGQ
jgi:tetratricopeptide (TPR) repeat protein